MTGSTHRSASQAILGMYTIDKDAMLGDHMITVSTDTTDDERRRMISSADMVLTVYIGLAGPPVETT